MQYFYGTTSYFVIDLKKKLTFLSISGAIEGGRYTLLSFSAKLVSIFNSLSCRCFFYIIFVHLYLFAVLT